MKKQQVLMRGYQRDVKKAKRKYQFFKKIYGDKPSDETLAELNRWTDEWGKWILTKWRKQGLKM